MDAKLKDELSEIIDDYASIADFIKEYNHCTAPEFDYYVVNKMSLFLVHDDFDFDFLDGMLTKIEDALPSIKRIFVKPIIHLKEDDEILPVEAVRLVNNQTIQHIASHSEYWDDVDENSIQPLKLLTRTYKDNYSIYENVLFARTINCILSYLRKNMRQLKSMMYATETLEFNLLERLNHLNYYLAIGKLHTGYIRDFGKYVNIARVANERMEVLYKSISARLKRNVYRLNKNYKGNFRLHDSNILHMQKDYHKVYLMYKNFNEINAIPKEIDQHRLEVFQKQYMDYVLLITIFSILNFNFEESMNSKIDFESPDIFFEFKNFMLHLTKDKKGGILLDFTKDKEYRIHLVPTWDKTKYEDNIVYITPYSLEDAYQLNISDVDSFRRIQKLLYEGMVYSDETFDTCQFCGYELKRISAKTEALVTRCPSCNAVITERKCQVHNKKYYATSIYEFRPYLDKGDISTILHYRNITKYSRNGEIICPVCDMVHSK